MEQKEDWTKAIIELETYFNSIVLPAKFELFPRQWIADLPKFVASHLLYCKQNNGRIRMKPYLYRLIKLKNLLSNV